MLRIRDGNTIRWNETGYVAVRAPQEGLAQENVSDRGAAVSDRHRMCPVVSHLYDVH